MRFLFLGLFILIIEGNCLSQAADCSTWFSIAETFDLKTQTDSTRFRPQFVPGMNDNPDQYMFVIHDKWGIEVFRTELLQQGWNGRINNRKSICPGGVYMWMIEFGWKKDSSFYTCTGFVTCINMQADVKVTALDTLNCVPSVYVPNALTPNEDGTNDMFTPVFSCPPVDYQMRIFDRWGNLIFETSDANKGWDGTAGDGITAPMDTYVWKISFRYYEGDAKHELIGHVALIR